jgi:hypothetical protein
LVGLVAFFIFLLIVKKIKIKNKKKSIRWARRQYGLDWFYTLATTSTSYKEKTTLGYTLYYIIIIIIIIYI